MFSLYFLSSLPAMTELKKSPYYNVNAAVLGSRDQLCLHPDLKELSNDQKIVECKSLIGKKECDFYETLDMNIPNEMATNSNPILDIEELHQIGSDRGCCPYFMSLNRIEQADIIFMPHNYLFASDMQISLELGEFEKELRKKLENAIIILDEAHNVPNVCNDCTSTSVEVYKAFEEIEYVSLIFHFNKLIKV